MKVNRAVLILRLFVVTLSFRVFVPLDCYNTFETTHLVHLTDSENASWNQQTNRRNENSKQNTHQKSGSA